MDQVSIIEPEKLIESGNLLTRARFNLDRARRLMCRRSRPEQQEAPRWLVERLIPRGELVVMAGDGGSGKSTVLHQLAVDVASPVDPDAPGDWLGSTIDRSRTGDVLFVTLEERAGGFFADREARLDPEGLAENLIAEHCEAKDDLDRILNEYGSLTPETGAPVLVVVDSASEFRRGSEIVDTDVNAFLDPLKLFASRTGAAVIVIHHFNSPKFANRAEKPVRSQAELKARVSGHRAWTNRPRVTLAIYRESDAPDALTRIGIIKQNAGLQDLEGLMKAYRRDQGTYRHVPVAEPEPARKKVGMPNAAAQGRASVAGGAAPLVLAAVTRIVGEGGRVTPTGQHELHQHVAPEVAGLARAKLRTVVKELVADGRLVQQPDGSLAPAEAAAALAAERSLPLPPLPNTPSATAATSIRALQATQQIRPLPSGRLDGHLHGNGEHEERVCEFLP